MCRDTEGDYISLMEISYMGRSTESLVTSFHILIKAAVKFSLFAAATTLYPFLLAWAKFSRLRLNLHPPPAAYKHTLSFPFGKSTFP